MQGPGWSEDKENIFKFFYQMTFYGHVMAIVHHIKKQVCKAADSLL
jgi:hypothetical protein